MMDIHFTERITENTDWATIAFISSVALVVLVKTLFEKKFVDFTNIILSSKFFKTYRDSNSLMSWFNILLVLVHFISFSFFIHLSLSYFGVTEKFNWQHLLFVASGLASFILVKQILDKLISFTFEINEFHSFYNLQKISYKNFIGILFIPINIFLFYNSVQNEYIMHSLIGLFITLNALAFINILRANSKQIISQFFYFFLYLCALEIAPYLIVSYWFIKLNLI